MSGFDESVSFSVQYANEGNTYVSIFVKHPQYPKYYAFYRIGPVGPHVEPGVTEIFPLPLKGNGISLVHENRLDDAVKQVVDLEMWLHDDPDISGLESDVLVAEGTMDSPEETVMFLIGSRLIEKNIDTCNPPN